MFDTFASPKPETLREQVQFLFMKDKRNFVDIYFSEKKGFINIDRQSGNGKVLSFAISHTRMKLLNVSFYESSVGKFDNQYGECLENNGQYNLIFKKGVLTLGQGLSLKTINAKWDGAVIKKEDGRIVAHGKGKWTFADGTTLEGEHVAEYGKPVFRLTYEEMQEYKRLKSAMI